MQRQCITNDCFGIISKCPGSVYLSCVYLSVSTNTIVCVVLYKFSYVEEENKYSVDLSNPKAIEEIIPLPAPA